MKGDEVFMDAADYISGMKCINCGGSKCVSALPEFNYECTSCGHKGYFGGEELEGRKPPSFDVEQDEYDDPEPLDDEQREKLFRGMVEAQPPGREVETMA